MQTDSDSDSVDVLSFWDQLQERINLKQWRVWNHMKHSKSVVVSLEVSVEPFVVWGWSSAMHCFRPIDSQLHSGHF